jgi:hypothetical protein
LFSPVEEGGRIAAFESDSVDQKQLLRFLVAILWRASVSSQSFYKRVQLGPYESDAAATIEFPHLPMPEVFGALLARWRTTEENDGAADAMLDPIRERLMNVNTYRVYLGRIMAWVRVSRLQFSTPMNRLELGSTPTVSVIARDFGRSKDLAAMVRVVTASDRGRSELDLH